MKAQRASYPRVNCLVPGCKRGTTRCKPNEDDSPVEIVCGKCFRKLPVAWRRRLSLYRRRFSAAEARDDSRGMDVAARCWWSMWERMKRALCNDEPLSDGEMPITLATQLQAEGLL